MSANSDIQLRNIAQDTNSDPAVRIAAINKLNSDLDYIYLRNIAQDTNSDPAVRIAAINKLKAN